MERSVVVEARFFVAPPRVEDQLVEEETAAAASGWHHRTVSRCWCSDDPPFCDHHCIFSTSFVSKEVVDDGARWMVPSASHVNRPTHLDDHVLVTCHLRTWLDEMVVFDGVVTHHHFA